MCYGKILDHSKSKPASLVLILLCYSQTNLISAKTSHTRNNPPIYAQAKQLTKQLQNSTKKVQRLTKQAQQLQAQIAKLTKPSAPVKSPRLTPAALMQATVHAARKQRRAAQTAQTLQATQQQLQRAQQQQTAWAYKLKVTQKTTEQQLTQALARLAAAKKRR